MKNALSRKLKIHGIYRHFKGNYYLVEDVAIHSEDLTEYVVYRQLYGEGGLYIRPKDMFLSEVDREKYPNVKQKYRFELISEIGGSRGARTPDLLGVNEAL